MSPTVLRIGPYRLFFFSNEGTEPPHRFGAGELRKIQRVVEKEAPRLGAAWHEYFDSEQ